MTKSAMQTKANPTMLVLLAGIGIVGLILARRYGAVRVLSAVNEGLQVARRVRPSATRHKRKRPARKVRPTVLRFSEPK